MGLIGSSLLRPGQSRVQLPPGMARLFLPPGALDLTTRRFIGPSGSSIFGPNIHRRNFGVRLLQQTFPAPPLQTLRRSQFLQGLQDFTQRAQVRTLERLNFRRFGRRVAGTGFLRPALPPGLFPGGMPIGRAPFRFDAQEFGP